MTQVIIYQAKEHTIFVNLNQELLCLVRKADSSCPNKKQLRLKWKYDKIQEGTEEEVAIDFETQAQEGKGGVNVGAH